MPRRLSLAALVLVGVGCRRNLFPSGAEPEPSWQPSAALNAPPVAEPSPRDVGYIAPAGDPGQVDVTFDIRTNSGAKHISPYVYGMADHGAPSTVLHWGVLRSGGNRATAYNWENNASNAGSDYLFQNDGLIDASDAPAKPYLKVIDSAVGMAAANIITLAIGDYVAADKNGGGDVRSSGPNYLSTRFKRNYAKKPGPFSAMPDPNDAAVYQDELVNFLKTQRPHAHVMFSLDNEPDLWAHTHAEVFPKPVTYRDLWRRNREFAIAAKAAWPGVEVLGPVSYGWRGFESLQNASDASGNFLEWYLDQARTAEKQEGVRLIDYLDLHWYPEATGGGKRIIGQDVDAESIAARVQAPRSLWDPNYDETSWVRDSAGGPLDLIHWVQKKINAHYPGTKLAFTEWNYGGGKHISGAIAVADVLGIFGRYGVALATYWPLVDQEPFAIAAYRAYLDYDGKGSRFGDTAVAATASNVSTSSVYASIDRSDATRTVIIAINKEPLPKTAGIKVAHATDYTRATTYVLTGSNPALRPGPALTAVAHNAFRYDMPGESVTVIVPQP